MDSSATAKPFKAADVLLGILRSRWLGYVLSGLAIVLIVALFLRYRLGYIPKFFVVSLPVALVVFATSLAAVMVQPTYRSAFSLLLSIAAVMAMVIGAALIFGIVAPTATQIYVGEQQARAQVFNHSLPGDAGLFRDGFDKANLSSFSDLPKWAGKFHERWRGELLRQGFDEGEAKAASLMLFTSTLWAFGNANQPRKAGCITVNEDNNWQHQKPTFQIVKSARIGCCTDYAHALSLILSRNGFENRYVEIDGHIFNEAKINGRWYVLDANTNLFINSAWNDTAAAPDQVRIHVFPHPGSTSGKLRRPLVIALRNYLVNIVLVGEFERGAVKDGRAPDPEYKESIDLLY